MGKDLNQHQLALLDAIKKGVKEAELRDLLNQITDLNFVELTGKSPLYLAVSYENTRAVKLLLEKKVNLNTRDVLFGNTPLHEAVRGGNDEIASLLLENGADPELKNNDGDTALHLYAKRGDQGGNTLLNKFNHKFKNAIYMQNNQGETPLHCAITSDNLYFFTFYVNALKNRYYGQVDLKKMHDSRGNNLVHTAVRRLSCDFKDNIARTYTILHLLAGVEPSLFREKNNGGSFSGCTPSDLLPKNASPEVAFLLSNPFTVYMATYADKELLGSLQGTLNGLRDENETLKKDNTELKAELNEIKNQLVVLTKLLANQQENNIKSCSLTMFQ